MNMLIAKRLGRIRHVHTIISQETITPSSPTPLHLKTHNLSLLDQFAPKFLMPKLLFYKHYNNHNTNILKKSLSKCLTQYYPFAGRFPPSSTSNYIDCNDEGVEFTEASSDSRIDDFILNRTQDQTTDQLLPDEGTGLNSLVKVKVNYLATGGAAIAVSISHKIADGYTAASFINHWASVTRGDTPIVNPNFTSTSINTKPIKIKIPEVMNMGTFKDNYISRRFIFANSKLKELKEKVVSSSDATLNPSRVELLTSLLYKCVSNSGDFKPSLLVHCVNMRNKIIKVNSPETTTGNMMTLLAAKIRGSRDVMLHEVVAELKKEKMKLDGLQHEEEVGQHFLNTLTVLGEEEGRAFISSSLCRFPFYEVDFGWGNPVKVMTRYPDVDDNGVILMDTPKGDGIEALVHLKKEEMPIFEQDEELLEYVEGEDVDDSSVAFG